MKINNFSKEGLGLLCDELLNKGEQVEIELIIPGG